MEIVRNMSEIFCHFFLGGFSKEKKTKNFILNFSKAKQFTTDLRLKNVSLEVLHETKLLGVYIPNDLKWNKNTEVLVKDANKRMRILHKAAKFTTILKIY